jgi:hypothetical protein
VQAKGGHALNASALLMPMLTLISPTDPRFCSTLRAMAPQHMHWRHIGANLRGMPSIQVKDVPEDVHATLRRRAAVAGQSLQEYLLTRLIEDAHTPTLDELLDRASGRAGGRAGFKAAVRAVRADRDTR